MGASDGRSHAPQGVHDRANRARLPTARARHLRPVEAEPVDRPGMARAAARDVPAAAGSGPGGAGPRREVLRRGQSVAPGTSPEPWMKPEQTLAFGEKDSHERQEDPLRPWP